MADAYAFNPDRSKASVYTKEEINQKKSIVLIGDSYGEGWTPDGTKTSWIQLVTTWLAKIGVQAFGAYRGGAGFACGTKFLTPLTNLVGTMTQEQKHSVEIIVVGGGYNDKSYNATQISEGMDDFTSYAYDNFPNLKKMILCPFGMCVQGLTTGAHASTTYEQVALTYRRYYQEGGKFGFCVAPGGYALLRKDAWFSSDYVHPNQDGQYILADFVMAALGGFTFDAQTYWHSDEVYPCEFGDDVDTTSGTVNLNARVHGTRAYVRFENFNINFKSGHYPTITCNGQGGSSNIVEIPIVTQHAVMQKFGQIYTPDVEVVVKYESNVYIDVPAWLIWDLTNQKLVIRFSKINDTGNNFLTLNDISQIQLHLAKSPMSYDLLEQFDV